MDVHGTRISEAMRTRLAKRASSLPEDVEKHPDVEKAPSATEDKDEEEVRGLVLIADFESRQASNIIKHPNTLIPTHTIRVNLVFSSAHFMHSKMFMGRSCHQIYSLEACSFQSMHSEFTSQPELVV